VTHLDGQVDNSEHDGRVPHERTGFPR
jgi:hypothetical protein